MAVSSMLNLLNTSGYLCDRRFAAQFTSAVNTRPIPGSLLQGGAGTGKTYVTEIYAKATGKEYFFYQCFPGTREEDLLVQLVPDDTTVSGMRRVEGVIVRALRATQEGKDVVLVLDEFDKTRPSADSFLLNLLQNLSVHYGDTVVVGDPSRITIFLTLNFERTLSEPLLRRLPKIDFEPLPVGQVAKALELTHPGNPYIDPVCYLYLRTLQARLPKPGTIQELRQLIDALAILGDDADWDMLVRQFVTKTEEAHRMLAAVEGEQLELPANGKDVQLSTDAYNHDPLGVAIHASLPATLPKVGSAPFIDPAPVPGEECAIYGTLPYSSAGYNAVVAFAIETLKALPGKDPANIGAFAKVVGDATGKAITILDPYRLEKCSDLNAIAATGAGTILLVERTATYEEFMSLYRCQSAEDDGGRECQLECSYFSEEKVAGMYGRKTVVTWEKGKGLEVVADFSAWEEVLELHKAWDGLIGFPQLREQRKAEAKERERLEVIAREAARKEHAQKLLDLERLKLGDKVSYELEQEIRRQTEAAYWRGQDDAIQDMEYEERKYGGRRPMRLYRDSTGKMRKVYVDEKVYDEENGYEIPF